MSDGEHRQSLHDLAEIASIRASMKRDASAEGARDFTACILDRVDQRRAFLSAKGRRRLWAARLGLGGAVVAGALSIVLLHRFVPGVGTVAQVDQPLSDVILSVQSETSTRLASFQQTVVGVMETRTPTLSSLVARAAEPVVHADGIGAGLAEIGGAGEQSSGCGDRKPMCSMSGGLTASCFVGPVRCRRLLEGDEAVASSEATSTVAHGTRGAFLSVARSPRERPRVLAVEPHEGMWFDAVPALARHRPTVTVPVVPMGLDRSSDDSVIPK